MNEAFSRSAQMLGTDAMAKLKNAHVAVFGVGGVGGMAAEALVRGGVGSITVVDNDTISVSNLNRQIFATQDTVGMDKVEAAKRRLLAINPLCHVVCKKMFYMPETAEEIDLSAFDYIVDAIDTVTAKIELALRAKAAGVPLISSMGTGNKLDPAAFQVADIYETSVCPLARVMRRELKARGIESLKVVYSKEEPKNTAVMDETGKRIPASVSFVPPAAGLVLSGEVIRDLIK